MMGIKARIAVTIVALSTLCLIDAFGKEAPFTLEEAGQARDSSRNSVLGLFGFASPFQRYIAWRTDGNIVIARKPDFAPEILVSRDEEGSVTSLYRSHDGGSIIYASRRKDYSGVHDLYSLNVSIIGSKPELIATGVNVPASRLVLARNGQAFAFAEGTMLFEFRRSEEGKWERRHLVGSDSDRGSAAAIGYSDIVYSPDGLKLAFTSKRKAGHQYVAVHSIADGSTSYIQPSVFVDSDVVWSSDGASVAFIRQPINLTKDYRFSSERGKSGGVPWSILVADVRTGAVRTAWSADAGVGSILARNTKLIWAPSGDILFSWEKTGWELLYSVPAAGGSATLLTPGIGEVQEYGLSADGHTIVYRANFDDPMRYHLWKVSLRDRTPVQITSGKGSERASRLGELWFNTDGYLSYFSEDSISGPPRIVIRGPDRAVHPLKVQPDHVVKRNQAIWDHFLPTETISVRAEDDVTSHHVVITPRAPPPVGGYPVIVNAHGGPTEQTTPSGGYAYTFGQYVAQHGYLFVDINYRGSTGFGLDYRLPDGRGATGGSELRDLVALVEYLKMRGDVNPKRVGIVGASYGGHMVGLAMSRLPDDFAAGVSQFGVADWVVEMKKDMEAMNGTVREPLYYQRLSERLHIEDLAYASSPNSQIEKWRGPTLLTIGDLDTNGHVEAVQDLGYQLLLQGVPVEFHVDPSGGHNVFAWGKVFEFFERTLSATPK